MRLSIVLEEETYQTLREYLLAREYDIAEEIEDFGCLADLFEEIIGRNAKRTESEEDEEP
jgi:hypothetical protein